VKLDYVLIQQVLINLLDNAAKYSGEDEPIGVRAQLSGQMLQVL
jgi:K+-sensing histidine kinase KdpD